MALKITVDNPAYPKGTELDIRGVGLVINGEAVTISEEQEQGFLGFSGTVVREAMKNDENLKVEGTATVSAPSEPPEVSTQPEPTQPTEPEGGE